GGHGGDYLAGGAGNDTIVGGTGPDVCRQGSGTGSQDCAGLVRSDPNDTRGRFDVSAVRLTPAAHRLRIRITTFSRWKPLAVWDLGFFVVLLDSAGDERPDYEILARPDRGELEAHLRRTSTTTPLARVAIRRPSGSA